MRFLSSYRFLVLLTGLLLVLGAGRLSAANTSGTDLGSDDDTYITQGSTGQPGGSSPNTPKEANLKVENNPTPGHPEVRSLIHFDLSQYTGLGAGSTVSAALLKLKFSDNSGSTFGAPGSHLRVYRVTTAWLAGDGTAVDNVGASWNQAKDGTALWTTAGGDFTPAVGSGVPVTAGTAGVMPATNNEIDFDIQAIVAGWVDGSFPNYGLIVIDDSESSQNDYYHFFDGVDYATGAAATGPNINVTYNAVTVTNLTATQDTSISSAINNCGVDHQTRLTGAVDERMLLKFAIGTIPGGDNVQSAILRIKSAGADIGAGEVGGQAGTDIVTVYKLTQPAWVEGTGTRAVQSTDGARWDKYDATNLWTTAGGDFDAARAFISPSTTIAGTNADVTIDIDVTAIVNEQHIAAAASADFIVKPGPLCDWRMGSKEYAGATPAAPRAAQLIVSSSTSAAPAITVTTPAGLTIGSSGTVNWTYTGLMSNFDVYLIDGSANVKKVNGSPVAGSAGAGTFSWTVNAGSPLTGAGAGYTIKVVESTKLFQGVSGSFTVSGPVVPVVITTSSPITAGQATVVYPGVTFAATGGTGPYTWTATGVPTGLTLSTGGVLSGTPTTASVSSMTVTATDSAGVPQVVNKTISITIAPAPGALALAFSTIPAPQTGVAYTFTATATGGIGAYTWSATGLPTGITINAATGVISGTTTDAVGTVANITVTVHDTVPTTVNSPVITVTVATATTTTTTMAFRKRNCEIGAATDWTSLAFLLTLAGAGMLFARSRRDEQVA